MSHNPNTVKSQSELNPCNQGKRSSDVLVEAISKLETITKENELLKEIIKDEMIKNGEILEEIERLDKQLDIAKRAMNKAYKQIDVVDRLGALHTLKRAWDRIEELNK